MNQKTGFVHIPRTGGTYLEALLCSMGPDKFINFFGTPQNQNENKIGLIENIAKDIGRQRILKNIPNWPTAQLFSGHFSLNIHDFLPNQYTYKYITILRNPLNRVVSFIKKVTSSKNFYRSIALDCDIGSDIFWNNFIEYYTNKKNDGLMPHEINGFSNYMTKAIAGLDLSSSNLVVDDNIYILAKNNLNKMIYVGQFEKYHNTIQHILSMFDCNIKNVSIRKENNHHISDHILSFLKSINEYDIQLYEEYFNE